MKAAQWQQEIVKPVVQLTPPSNVSNTSKAIKSVEASGGCAEKKAEGSVVRPPREQPLPCPRCNSTNTKFCYYNNYSLTQPRYFCKGCRRYWTEGGSLRNIPVGGCSRKNKRSPSSSANNPPGPVGSKKPCVLSPLQNPNLMMIHPPDHRAVQSLNLTFPAHHQDYRSISADLVHMSNAISFQSTTATQNEKSHQSALELLTGMSSAAGGGLGFGGGFTNSFMHISDPDSVYASARISDIMQDFKSPTLDFSLDYGLGTRQGNNSGVGMSSQNDPISTSGGVGVGRDLLMSPFDSVKNQPQSYHHHDQHHYEQQAASQNRGHGVLTGYWTEMLGDGNRSNW